MRPIPSKIYHGPQECSSIPPALELGRQRGAETLEQAEVSACRGRWPRRVRFDYFPHTTFQQKVEGKLRSYHSLPVSFCLGRCIEAETGLDRRASNFFSSRLLKEISKARHYLEVMFETVRFYSIPRRASSPPASQTSEFRRIRRNVLLWKRKLNP